jgi:hypothetical protein
MESTHPLNTLPFFTYGTTRLGDSKIPFEERVKLALAVMEKNIPFHTSHQYGDTLQVLGEAFKRKPSSVPKLMIKIGGSSIDELRADIRKNLEPLGVPGMEVGQLCIYGSLAEELARGGPCYQELKKIQAEGLVKHYVLEVFPWTSETALKALAGGHLPGGVEALIFYFNPLQRFASNALWDLVLSKKFPFLALRTVGGGDVHALRDVPGAAWKPYLQERAAQVAPLFERSGISSWPEFCVRFASSFPLVLGTIGASSQVQRVDLLLEAAKNPKALPGECLEQLMTLQRRWSDETDMKAEPWTM